MLPEHKGYDGNLVIGYYLDTMMGLPERQAMTCLTENRTFTYGELDKITNQLDYKFRQVELKKDDVVMVCLLNTWQFPMLLLGAWKTPCIFSPINFRLSPGEVAIHLDDSKPKVFVWDSVFDPLIKGALELSKHKPSVLLSTKESMVPGAILFEDYYKDAPDEDPDVEDRVQEILDPIADEVLRHYTSGTTGQPKGTRQTSSVMLHMDAFITAEMGVNWSDNLTNLTPWFHQGGIPLVTAGLSLGAHLFGMPLAPFSADEMLDNIEKYKLTMMMAAPPIYNALAVAQQAKPRDLSSIRWIHTMGAPFSRDEYTTWCEHLTTSIGNTYGTTETRGDSILSSKYHDMKKHAGSIGRPARLCRIRLIKVRPGERVEPNEMVPKDGKTQGEIISKSPSMFIGYYNRPEDDAKHLYKGWFYSGDMASWDEEGFITIQGRTDDVIQSGAEKVYPVPVEESLMGHLKVEDVFVIGIPHKRWGQAVAAYVVPKEGRELSVAELDEHCRKDPYLADYTRPRYYRFVDGPLPYTATAKKMHYVLADKAKEKDELEKFMPIASEKK